MALSRFIRIYLFIAALLSCVMGCSRHEKYPFKVYYINSYHKGYPSSDSIMNRLQNAFESHNIKWQKSFLDTKQASPDVIKRNIKKTLEGIYSFQPNLILASDDDAVSMVVKPYFDGSEIPVVFCGVNWTAEPYHLSHTNITGVLEILPLREVFDTTLLYFPKAKQITILTEDSPSARKDTLIIKNILHELGLKPTFAFCSTFDDWKNSYSQAVQQADIIYFPTQGSIQGWDKNAALMYMDKVGYKPIITCDDFMMPYAMLGIVKQAGEQADLAVESILEIKNGTSTENIPIKANQKNKIWINPLLITKINLIPHTLLLESAASFKH